MSSDNKVEVILKPHEIKVLSYPYKTLLDILREHGISIRADCGGIGVCGKCRIKLEFVNGVVSNPSLNELKILGEKNIVEGHRLACQIKLVSGSFVVYVPYESMIQKYRSADVGLETPVRLKPAVAVYRVVLSKPTLKDPHPDFDRIVNEVKKTVDLNQVELPLNLLQNLPEIIRKAKWDVDIVVWNSEKIIDVKPHEDIFKPYGIAVDLGTSRIVVHLVDLVSGETIAVESTPNPQTVYGADIISRLVYASTSEENLQKLQTLVVNTINTLIDKISRRTSIPFDHIYEAVVACNTVMHHIFLAIQPKYLGVAPYTPVIQGPLHYEAKDLNLKINKHGVIYLPPVIAGFVGSDAVADAVAVNIDECSEPCLLIDIGTNTEIILNTGEIIVAGSTPAGPAFEGVSMSFGVKAVEGAIDQVFIYFDDVVNDYVVKYNVIGGKKPIGICGSGYIDLVANLYKLGILNKRGKFVSNMKSLRIIKENKLTKFVVVKNEETAIGRDITVDEKDIDNLLLAKAAVASGIKVLLNYVNLDVEKISRIFVAGSFGSYLNIDNAITIGLLPEISVTRYVFVGNACITGAKAILRSKDIREKAVALAKKIKYVEISAQPQFKKIFSESLYLP